MTETDMYTPEEEDDRDDQGFDPDHLPEPPEEFLIDFTKNGWQEINTTLKHPGLTTVSARAVGLSTTAMADGTECS